MPTRTTFSTVKRMKEAMARLFFRDALFCPLACQCGIDEKVLVNAPKSGSGTDLSSLTMASAFVVEAVSV
jgi:hypothetical protein